MKITNNTVNVFKNFSTINPSIVIKQGHVQSTISQEKSIVAIATVEDSFPNEFGIYDLNQFLGNISTLKDPDLEFNDKTVIIKDNEMSLTFFACDPNLIEQPPEEVEKKLKITDDFVEFSISQEFLQKLLKIAALNNLNNISITGKEGNLYIKTHNKQVDTSNFATMNLSTYTGEDFEATFDVQNLKMIPDNYNVKMSKTRFAIFTNQNNTLKYYIALLTNKK